MIKQDRYFIGIGFWIGGAAFSVINIFKIRTHADILNYDYIMTGVAVIFILLSLMLLLLGKNNKGDNRNTKDKYGIGYKFGIGFWIGGGVYSLINMIMNLKNVPPSNILSYNYLIAVVAVIGLILNVILFIKEINK